MDVADVLVKPVKDFAKSSARLVKRCTKPDRKGTFQPSVTANSRLPDGHIRSLARRVQQDRSSHSSWIRSGRVHRLLREANLHCKYHRTTDCPSWNSPVSDDRRLALQPINQIIVGG